MAHVCHRECASVILALLGRTVHLSVVVTSTAIVKASLNWIRVWSVITTLRYCKSSHFLENWFVL